MSDRKIAVWEPTHQRFAYLHRDATEDHRSHAGREEYGDSGFTGSIAIRHLDGPYRGQRVIFRWEDHLSRFEATAAANALVKVLPCSRDLITQVVGDLVTHNDQPYIRCVIGGGGGTSVYKRGLPPRFHIRTEDIDPVKRNYLGPEACEHGLRVLITDWRRGYPDAVTFAKSASNYQRSIQAKDEAVEQGYDEGALVDWTGRYLSEVSVANVIVIKGQRAFRPDHQCGALDSITRRTAEALLKDVCNIETDPILIGPREIEEADEIMVCGTAVGVLRMRECHWPGGGVSWHLRRSSAEQRVPLIDTAYSQLIQGLKPSYRPEWFTPVSQLATTRIEKS